MKAKKQLIEELKKAKLAFACYLPNEIQFLSNTLNKGEAILAGDFSFSKMLAGLFIITDKRILFLNRIQRVIIKAEIKLSELTIIKIRKKQKANVSILFYSSRKKIELVRVPTRKEKELIKIIRDKTKCKISEKVNSPLSVQNTKRKNSK